MSSERLVPVYAGALGANGYEAHGRVVSSQRQELGNLCQITVASNGTLKKYLRTTWNALAEGI